MLLPLITVLPLFNFMYIIAQLREQFEVATVLIPVASYLL
jgi:hypothetical protein